MKFISLITTAERNAVINIEAIIAMEEINNYTSIITFKNDKVIKVNYSIIQLSAIIHKAIKEPE